MSKQKGEQIKMGYIGFAAFMLAQYGVLHATLGYSMNYGKLSNKH